MKLVAQTDPILSYPIRRFGCRFMSLLGIPQVWLDSTLFPKEIQDIYDQAATMPKVIVNPATALCGSAEDWIINAGFRALNSGLKGIQIGEIRDGVPRRWSGKEEKNFDFIIAHWITNGADGHFTLLDSSGKEVYDPFDARLADYELVKKSISRQLIYKIY